MKWMRKALLIVTAGLVGGCELVLGIGDPTLIGSIGASDDAGAGERDGGTIALSCQPLDPLSCGPGSKCTWLSVEARTGCAPLGPAIEGEPCEPDGLGPGIDDCGAGLLCTFGVCRAICALPDTCVSGQSCVIFSDTFVDSREQMIGQCGIDCDPVFQTCETAGEACYPNVAQLNATCAPVLESAFGLHQDEVCFGPQPGACFTNGCDEGHAGILPVSPGAAIDRCAFMCTPVDTHTGNTTQPGGSSSGISCSAQFDGARPDGPGGAHQCRFVNTFYSNTQSVPATFGLCVDPTVWGDCRECDITNLDTVDATCFPGCVSEETLRSVPPAGAP